MNVNNTSVVIIIVKYKIFSVDCRYSRHVTFSDKAYEYLTSIVVLKQGIRPAIKKNREKIKEIHEENAENSEQRSIKRSKYVSLYLCCVSMPFLVESLKQ